jgi:agmatinase
MQGRLPAVGTIVNRPSEPGYAGLGTFCKVPQALTPDDLRGADVAVLGAPVDGRVTNRPGARFGPRAIRNVASGAFTPPSRPHVALGIDAFEHLAVVDYGDIEPPTADLESDVAQLRARIGEILAAGALPVTLGGDHSILHPVLGSVAAHHGADRLAVVQFDSHADTTDAGPGTLTHGTPVRLLVEEGAIDPEWLFQVGLRGYWPPPETMAWAKERGIVSYTMDDVEQRGIAGPIGDIVERVRQSGRSLYITFDVDSLDPAFAPGTGTPEAGGLTSRELLGSIRRLAGELPLAGFDVVEVSPPYDHGEITAVVAHQAILEALSAVALRRRDGGR